MISVLLLKAILGLDLLGLVPAAGPAVRWPALRREHDQHLVVGLSSSRFGPPGTIFGA